MCEIWLRFGTESEPNIRLEGPFDKVVIDDIEIKTVHGNVLRTLAYCKIDLCTSSGFSWRFEGSRQKFSTLSVLLDKGHRRK